MQFIKFILISFIFVIPLSSFSQDVKVVRDLRLRNSLNIEKEITKRLLVFGETEIGLEKDMSQLGKLYAEIGLGYSPFKFITFDTKYRYSKNRKNFSEAFKFTHLFAFSAEGKYKLDRFKSYYRIQYQNIDEDVAEDELNKASSNLIKNRIKIKYNIKGLKLTPFITSELYVSIKQTGINFTKIKSTCGFEYEFNKNHGIKVYYRNDKELTSYLPYMYHTLGLSYNLHF